jgi:nucleoside-diphosphate-sugar epimerase
VALLHDTRLEVVVNVSGGPVAATRTVLVTGAAGFAGRVLVGEARRRGLDVRAAVRAPIAGWPAGVASAVVGDLASADLSAALQGVDTVVHLAARVHVMKDGSADPLADFRRVNVDATVRLARAAIRAGVRRFVFASSVKVLGDETPTGRAFDDSALPRPGDPYGRSKLEAELALAEVAAGGAIEVTVLRPVVMYGPGVKGNIARLLRWVEAGVPLPFGAIENRRSLLGVHNFADAVLAAASHPAAAGRTFVIADGEDLSTPELVRRIGRAIGVPARLVAVPVPVLRIAGGLLGPQWWQRLGGSLQVDASGFRAALGWVPPLTVDAGLAGLAAEVSRRHSA